MDLRSNGIVRPSGSFYDRDAEKDYAVHIALTSAKRIKKVFATLSLIWVFWCIYYCMKMFSDEPKPYILGTYVLSLILALAGYFGISARGGILTESQKLEKLVSLALFLMGTSFLVGTSIDVQSEPFHECWRGGSGGTPDATLGTLETGSGVNCSRTMNVWIVFFISFSIFPFASALFAFQIRVVGFSAFSVILVGTNAVHAFISVTLVPSSILFFWIGLFYVILPLLVLFMCRDHETRKREVFLLQTQLAQENASLTAKLNAVQRAAAFEAPTTEEQQIVSAVMKDSSHGPLKYVEIPFEELSLLNRVAAGSFGEVIQATYAGTTVAVKRMLRTHINERSLHMLVQEILVLQGLRHPNIVQFVGASWDSAANICLVLEYFERGSLDLVLEDLSLPLTWADPKLKMATDIASGLLYLHSRSTPVIHRDIKPANVLITPTFGCKLTDFGASRTADASITMTQIGTKAYMAPEVMRGARYDEKVDVYAVGIMLVVMHTRQKAFGGMEAGLLVAVLSGQRPEIPSDMPDDVIEIARACWQDDPECRPSSSEVLRRLKTVQVDEEKMMSSSETGGISSDTKARIGSKIMSGVGNHLKIMSSSSVNGGGGPAHAIQSYVDFSSWRVFGGGGDSDSSNNGVNGAKSRRTNLPLVVTSRAATPSHHHHNIDVHHHHHADPPHHPHPHHYNADPATTPITITTAVPAAAVDADADGGGVVV